VKTLESKETKASKEITVTHNSVFAAHRLQCRMTIHKIDIRHFSLDQSQMTPGSSLGNHAVVRSPVSPPARLRCERSRASPSLPSSNSALNLGAPLLGRLGVAVFVVPLPPFVRRSLRVALWRVFPLLLAPERSHIEVAPSAPVPHLVAIRTASLDDPSWFNPQVDMWTSDAHSWDQMNAALPKFEKYPSKVSHWLNA
jgi:hypothetical protein